MQTKFGQSKNYRKIIQIKNEHIHNFFSFNSYRSIFASGSDHGAGGQQIGGVQKTNDFLDKSTWTLATALLVLILISNVSIMDGNNGFGDSKIFDEDEVENALPEATPAPAQQNEQTQTAPAADSAQ